MLFTGCQIYPCVNIAKLHVFFSSAPDYSALVHMMRFLGEENERLAVVWWWLLVFTSVSVYFVYVAVSFLSAFAIAYLLLRLVAVFTYFWAVQDLFL